MIRYKKGTFLVNSLFLIESCLNTLKAIILNLTISVVKMKVKKGAKNQ